jgi:hypothetical protein
MTKKLEAFAKKVEGLGIPCLTLSDITRTELRVEGSATVHNTDQTHFDWWCVETDQGLMFCTEHTLAVKVRCLEDVTAQLNTAMNTAIAVEQAAMKDAEIKRLSSTPNAPPVKIKVLLIWEEIPDKFKLFLVDRDNPMVALMRKSNGLYINGDDLPDNHVIFTLMEWVNQEGQEFLTTTPVKGRISEVYGCGFLL